MFDERHHAMCYHEEDRLISEHIEGHEVMFLQKLHCSKVLGAQEAKFLCNCSIEFGVWAKAS